MYYSYVMGVDSSIDTLSKDGFIAERDGDNYMLSFPENKAEVWENFITQQLEVGYWNEYLTDTAVIFNFHLEDGIHKYIVMDHEDDEVLELCEKLCECKFESLKSMLLGNHFYRDKLSNRS